ncbi:uncharacterized protein B0I36DRAFT_318124 [Microdochium trichocladiopsis]|uniref:Uncharacterized protein n=1 Tax=Microdochium trichocladiopsis TaxID=1682393 RepID=A0A9P9BT75_9PEZI|nr:uncharacterized protein B0I36DRAFT_318124 [Microdochium trichocladiopsis]KAH7035339.1 hypothetical protein B0I36DRAFT_318124 [Microdochium trichocladiopsis]
MARACQGTSSQGTTARVPRLFASGWLGLLGVWTVRNRAAVMGFCFVMALGDVTVGLVRTA